MLRLGTLSHARRNGRAGHHSCLDTLNPTKQQCSTSGCAGTWRHGACAPGRRSVAGTTAPHVHPHTRIRCCEPGIAHALYATDVMACSSWFRGVYWSVNGAGQVTAAGRKWPDRGFGWGRVYRNPRHPTPLYVSYRALLCVVMACTQPGRECARVGDRADGPGPWGLAREPATLKTGVRSRSPLPLLTALRQRTVCTHYAHRRYYTPLFIQSELVQGLGRYGWVPAGVPPGIRHGGRAATPTLIPLVHRYAHPPCTQNVCLCSIVVLKGWLCTIAGGGGAMPGQGGCLGVWLWAAPAPADRPGPIILTPRPELYDQSNIVHGYTLLMVF